MPKVDKEVICPLYGCSELFDAEIDTDDPDQVVDCPGCGETLAVEVDPATGEVTLVELMEEGEDGEEEADEITVVEAEDEAGETEDE